MVMSSTQHARDTQLSRLRAAVIDPIYDSILLQLATVGAVLIVLGAIMNVGVWAAIFPVWGAGLVLVGLSCYGFIWWQRQ